MIPARQGLLTSDRFAELDGRRSAPSGAPQYPRLFGSFKRRPPWKVAGVDYRVGINSGVVLRNASGIDVPGSSIVGDRVFLDTAGVTVNGWDFTAFDVFMRADNLTFTNCRFAPSLFSASGSEANNVVWRYCQFDGSTDPPIATVGINVAFEYCWFAQTQGDWFQYQGDAGGTLVWRWCLIENAAQGVGAHGDYLQDQHDPYVAKISFNTTRQAGGTTQGFMCENASSGFIDYNVFVSISGLSYFTRFDSAPLTGRTSISNNYFDTSDASGLAHPGTGNTIQPGDGSAVSVFANNVSLNTGGTDEND